MRKPRVQLALLCALFAFGPAAAAQAGPKKAPAPETASGCSFPATTQAFASFGDYNSYYLAPGGGFEGGISWAKSGSVSLVTPNEPFYLAGRKHQNAAALGAGGMVTTPTLCVTPDTPHMRFVAKALSPSGQLDVTVRFYGPDGLVTDSSGGGISPDKHVAWAPSGAIDLKTGNLQAGETGYVDVVFYAQGPWLIDDLFIDPRASR